MNEAKANPTDLRPVSEATLRRLPSYHHFLRKLQATGRDVVSCTHIGNALQLDPTQVRKDLASTGIVGRPKVGYHIPRLLDAIEGFLGWNNLTDAVLVGAGSLGTALLGYGRFNQYGLNIVAAFDANPRKIDTIIHDKQILPIAKLPNLAHRLHVLMGILAVPAEAAQAVADLMVEGGIQAIWNFAPTALQVPEGTVVQNEDLFSGLAVLSSKLAEIVKSNHS